MQSRTVEAPQPQVDQLPVNVVSGIADLLDVPFWSRSEWPDYGGESTSFGVLRNFRDTAANVFELLHVDPRVIMDQMDRGEREVHLQMEGP